MRARFRCRGREARRASGARRQLGGQRLRGGRGQPVDVAQDVQRRLGGRAQQPGRDLRRRRLDLPGRHRDGPVRRSGAGAARRAGVNRPVPGSPRTRIGSPAANAARTLPTAAHQAGERLGQHPVRRAGTRAGADARAARPLRPDRRPRSAARRRRPCRRSRVPSRTADPRSRTRMPDGSSTGRPPWRAGASGTGRDPAGPPGLPARAAPASAGWPSPPAGRRPARPAGCGRRPGSRRRTAPAAAGCGRAGGCARSGGPPSGPASA